MTYAHKPPISPCQAVHDAPLRAAISFLRDADENAVYVFTVELIPFIRSDPEGTLYHAAIYCGFVSREDNNDSPKTPLQQISIFIDDADDLVKADFLQQLVPHFSAAPSTVLLYAMRAGGWRPDASPENVEIFAHIRAPIRRRVSGVFRATTRSMP